MTKKAAVAGGATFFPEAGKPDFKVYPDSASVVGFCRGNRTWRFTRKVPVARGDRFRYAPGRGLLVNGKPVPTKARPWTSRTVRISWVSRILEVALFPDRDRIWAPGTKRHGKPGRLHWTACDLRSYHIGCADTPVGALRALILQVKATEILAREAKIRERKKVVRWRCLLPADEKREMRAKALKDGILLGDLDWRTSDWKGLSRWRL